MLLIYLILFLIYSFKCKSVERDVNEDCVGDSDSPLTDYNDIDDDGVLTPLRIDEEDLFREERKKKRLEVYDHLSLRLHRDLRML